jgi:hypothetical protein
MLPGRYHTTAAIIFAGLPAAAHAGLTSQVQLNFFETGYSTAYSSTYNAGDDISFTETYGGYTLLISADSDDIYGNSSLGSDPFLSLTVQVHNVGATPPANPVRIGMSITGLDSAPGTLIEFDSSFTGIFHTAASANFHTYYDPSDTLFGRTDALSQFNGISSQSNSDDQSIINSVSSPYSMGIFMTFTPVAFSSSTLDGQLFTENVPEPTSLAVLGVSLLCLRLRRHKTLRPGSKCNGL